MGLHEEDDSSIDTDEKKDEAGTDVKVTEV